MPEPRERSLRATRIVAWLLVAMVVVQFYSAGMALFGAASFKLHQIVGSVSVIVAIAMTVLALVARAGKVIAWHAAGAIALTMLQPVLVFVVRSRAPWIAALHPVVGLMIGLLAWRVAKGAGGNRTPG
jgi:hypothetical protein